MSKFKDLIPDIYDAFTYQFHVFTFKNVMFVKPFGPYQPSDVAKDLTYNLPYHGQCVIDQTTFSGLDAQDFTYEWGMVSFINVTLNRHFMGLTEGHNIPSMSIDLDTSKGHNLALTLTTYEHTVLYWRLDPFTLFFES